MSHKGLDSTASEVTHLYYKKKTQKHIGCAYELLYGRLFKPIDIILVQKSRA